VRVNYGFARIFGFDTKDVWASATAVLGPKKTLTSDLLIPILLSDQIAYQDFLFGDEREFGVVEDWQTGFLGPGNWLSARFEGDQGEADYIDRLAGTADPVTVAIGDYIGTEPGAASGEGTAGSKTYAGLIAKKFQPNGTVKEKDAGRILLETDPRFQASTTPQGYYRTGYNPDAWDNWVAAKDPATGMYPYSKRIVIMPIIMDTADATTGRSLLEVVGFAAFFITRVYDGETPDASGQVPPKGDIEGYFIQAIMGTDENPHWIFPAEGDELDDPNTVRVVRLVS